MSWSSLPQNSPFAGQAAFAPAASATTAKKIAVNLAILRVGNWAEMTRGWKSGGCVVIVDVEAVMVVSEDVVEKISREVRGRVHLLIDF